MSCRYCCGRHLDQSRVLQGLTARYLQLSLAPRATPFSVPRVSCTLMVHGCAGFLVVVALISKHFGSRPRRLLSDSLHNRRGHKVQGRLSKEGVSFRRLDAARAHSAARLFLSGRGPSTPMDHRVETLWTIFVLVVLIGEYNGSGGALLLSGWPPVISVSCPLLNTF